jgi:3-oxoacyl-[acyl-carrier protein] reductase
MDLGITGRNAVVTGGSLGIGRAVAAELAAHGVNVVIVARNEERLRAAAAALSGPAPGRNESGRVIPIAADLSRADEIERMTHAARMALGRIDILVNNAGSSPASGLVDTPDSVWQSSIDLKLMGYVRCARAFIPEMAARKWGRVVNVIGLGGHQIVPRYVAGGAINAALLNVTKSLAKEFAAAGVTVNGVNPGPTETPRLHSLWAQRAKAAGTTVEEIAKRSIATVPMGRAGTAEEVAAMVVFLCSEQAGYISGSLVDVDGAAASGL